MPRQTVYKPTEKIKPIYTGGTLTPPKFMPSYYEWLSTKGKRIIKTIAGLSTTITLYQVPINNTLFIISAFIEEEYLAGAGATVPTIMIDATQERIILTQVIIGTASHTSNSLSFPIPVIVRSGEKIRFSANTTNKSAGGITGFLVKNQDIPVF